MSQEKKGFQRYDLVDRVLDALPRIGYKIPTEVQHQVIPLILQRRNILVEAATGTGKTAAYGLPLLSRIDFYKRNTQALVLVPSRELALQVEAALRSFCTHDQFRVSAIYGGEDIKDSEKKLKSGGQVLVAVPGRLKDVLRLGHHDFFWRDIKYLIIDEADKLLEQGFQDTLDNLVSNVRTFVQVALFSATISADVEALIRERFAPIMTVRLSPKEALKNIKFHYVVVDRGQKPRYLAGILQEKKVTQGLIFCSKREEVYELANFLRAVGRKAESYHGLLDQVEREAIMGRFKNKQVEFLVATDLAARGLDVQTLPAVINYSFPDDIEVYLHRCGRTGRAGRRGAVYNLVASKKEEIVVQAFHGQLDIPLGTFEVNPVAKELVGDAPTKVVKIHLNRGKTDKVSAGDVVGFLTHATGVPADEIGTIAVYDEYTTVDLPFTFLELLEGIEQPKLKGKSVKIGRYTLGDMKHKAEAVRKSQLGVRDKKALSKISRKSKSKVEPEDALPQSKPKVKLKDAADGAPARMTKGAPEREERPKDKAASKDKDKDKPRTLDRAKDKPKSAPTTGGDRPGRGGKVKAMGPQDPKKKSSAKSSSAASKPKGKPSADGKRPEGRGGAGRGKR
jgi:superfamily II DNA/RNA helicase